MDAMVYDGRDLPNGFVEKALAYWNLIEYADVNLHDLSGGFRKLVLIATQVEARTKNDFVVAINVQQQLDITRFQLVERRFIDLGVRSVLWVDDNTSLLLKKTANTPSRVSLSQWLQMFMEG